jgi:hypothetical protein
MSDTPKTRPADGEFEQGQRCLAQKGEHVGACLNGVHRTLAHLRQPGRPRHRSTGARALWHCLGKGEKFFDPFR